jgi:hypothetical protein
VKEDQYLKKRRVSLVFMQEDKKRKLGLMQQKIILKELMSLKDNNKNN